MNCDCLDRFQVALNEKFGKDTDPHFIGLKTTINPKTGELGVSLDPLWFKRRTRKKNGTPSQKWVKSYIAFTYCPFCGKPVNAKKEEVPA